MQRAYLNELPQAPKALHPPPVRVARPKHHSGLEPVYRHQRLWRERHDRDSDQRLFPKARRTPPKLAYHRSPTEFTWKSPIKPDYMAHLVRKHCTGRRQQHLLECYRHGHPDHFRGPPGVSNIPVNFVKPGDPGAELVDEFVDAAVNAHAAVATKLAIFPGVITMAVGVAVKQRLGREPKRRVIVDGGRGRDVGNGVASWAASEGARFTSTTTVMRIAELIAHAAGHGSLEDYHQAFRTIRICCWGICRNAIYWRGRFVFFGACVFGKTVTPAIWENHADLLEREQRLQMQLVEDMMRRSSTLVSEAIGLGPSGRLPIARINRIVDDSLVTVPRAYTQDASRNIMLAFRRVCTLAGQTLQDAKRQEFKGVVPFDGFLFDLEHHRAGVPEGKCFVIRDMIKNALAEKLTPKVALSLLGKQEHISGVISALAPLTPAFRACAHAAEHRPSVRLSAEAHADLRRWDALLSLTRNGAAIWAPFNSLLLTEPPTVTIQTDASGDPNLGVGGYLTGSGKPIKAFAYSWPDLLGGLKAKVFEKGFYSTAYIELVGLYVALEFVSRPYHGQGIRWSTDSEAGSKAWSNRRSSSANLNHIIKDVGFVLARAGCIIASSWVSREHPSAVAADHLSRLGVLSFNQVMPRFGAVASDPLQSAIRGLRRHVSTST